MISPLNLFFIWLGNVVQLLLPSLIGNIYTHAIFSIREDLGRIDRINLPFGQAGSSDPAPAAFSNRRSYSKFRDTIRMNRSGDRLTC